MGHVGDQTPSLAKMMELRRESAGAAPLYHLVEYAHGLQLPDEVMQDSTIRELEILGMDMVFMYVSFPDDVGDWLLTCISTNDILSYKKEEVGTHFSKP